MPTRTRGMPAITPTWIETRILKLCGRRILLDRDLAAVYGVATRTLNQAVGRNLNRFPPDFMFRLSGKEFANWKSQFVTSNSSDYMGLRKRPRAFTQEGAAMLSGVLRSRRAVQHRDHARLCACTKNLAGA